MVMLRKQGGTKEIMWDAGYRIGLGAREPGKAQHTAREAGRGARVGPHYSSLASRTSSLGTQVALADGVGAPW